MNIVLITQADPFYISDSIQELLKRVSKKHTISACVLLKASPFGKNLGFFNKVVSTFKIFGAKFFIYYTLKFIYAKLFKKNVSQILKKFNVTQIDLKKSINHTTSLEEIKKYAPDLLISLAGNQIFKTTLINLAPLGCLNLHTAKLPLYRGLMPTFWALKNNEKEIGISVFQMDEGIDSGPILVQKVIPIKERVQSKLIRETKLIGIECIVEAIEKIESGQATYIENDDKNSSYYSFPSKMDVKDFLASGARFF